MATNATLHSDLAIPPGEYLSEVLEELGMTQIELAHRTGRPEQAISQIVNGHKAITAETALQLEQVVGVPAHIWMGLEDEYQLVLARNENERSLDDDAGRVDATVYRAMAKLGWVKPARSIRDKARALRRFFGVASLANVSAVVAYEPAFRVSSRLNASEYALAAWLRRGELEIADADIAPFNESGLKDLLPELRRLTMEDEDDLNQRLHAMFASCGVALVLLPHLPKAPVQGATYWKNGIAVVQLSSRYRWADIFWFSLFHELAHILLHGRRAKFIEWKTRRERSDPEVAAQETEADEFASELLVPSEAYRGFIVERSFDEITVREFASRIGVAPGVVVGRLQHDQLIPYSHLNDLRVQYEF